MVCAIPLFYISVFEGFQDCRGGTILAHEVGRLGPFVDVVALALYRVVAAKTVYRFIGLVDGVLRDYRSELLGFVIVERLRHGRDLQLRREACCEGDRLRGSSSQPGHSPKLCTRTKAWSLESGQIDRCLQPVDKGKNYAVPTRPCFGKRCLRVTLCLARRNRETRRTCE
jgi:hypothetical protein